ncbi:ABC transporter permease [Anaeromyxobacter paludicola]|uniref:ABC3 transporter permease protein domain-containing protein n=1 Tax=Anaeromyxobacter paludicola TaxID=2918171 RepID=A0ABM7X5H0_9BACT|nr:FtsX-like permease family protein [Anaeromyxobacter paludicola]BDG07066.1 hypothetical protein AMPC_01790 [Anaeromyxobacter paludicola]
MPGTVRIAWRSLWRNRRRTALALAAIGLSQALVLFYDGIMRGYGDWMVAVITGPMLGHAQAHAPGWRRERSVDLVLPRAGRALAAIRGLPEVAQASARVWAPALAALGEDGHAVVVVGLDPAAEAHRHGLLAGAAPGALAGREVLVGRLLAEKMGIRPGATLALVGQAADGSLANDLVRVAGLLDTSVDEVNRLGVVMSLPAAQELFALGDAAHELVIHARDPAKAPEVAARAARLPELAGAEVLDWKSLDPGLVSIVALVRASGLFILLLVFVAAAAGVANTMLMATFERTHELGMLLALGVTPRRVVGLVVAEALALGLTGAALGTALGGALVALTHARGFDLARLMGGGPAQLSFAGLRMSMRFYPSLGWVELVQSFGAVAVTSLLAAGWPAARAARLEPARAMRG